MTPVKHSEATRILGRMGWKVWGINKRGLAHLCRLILFLVVAYAIAFMTYWHHQRSLLTVHPVARFLNRTGFAQVRFRSRDGLIWVIAVIDGQARECSLDTGATTTHIPRPRTQLVEEVSSRLFFSVGPPVPRLISRPLSIEKSRSIQIGDYTVENVPVRSYDTLQQDPRNIRQPLLGNDLFRGVTVTIDWRTETLVIASPSSDEAPAHIAGWNQVIGFQSSTSSRSHDNLILLPGMIDGEPSLLAFDTGHFIDPLGIVDRSLARRLAVKHEAQFQSEMLFFSNITWSIAGTQFTTDASASLANPQNFQALLGTAYLLLYRVGIDYSAHRLYLHRYQANEKSSQSMKRERRLLFGTDH